MVMKKLVGVGCRATFQESGEKGNWNVHKGRLTFFCDFWKYLPTYLCLIHYMLSIYVLVYYVPCPIFLDIPTYPKIGHS